MFQSQVKVFDVELEVGQNELPVPINPCQRASHLLLDTRPNYSSHLVAIQFHYRVQYGNLGSGAAEWRGGGEVGGAEFEVYE